MSGHQQSSSSSYGGGGRGSGYNGGVGRGGSPPRGSDRGYEGRSDGGGYGGYGGQQAGGRPSGQYAGPSSPSSSYGGANYARQYGSGSYGKGPGGGQSGGAGGQMYGRGGGGSGYYEHRGPSPPRGGGGRDDGLDRHGGNWEGSGGGRGGTGGPGRGGGRGGGGGGGRNPRAPPPIFVPLPYDVPAVPAVQSAKVPKLEPVSREQYGDVGRAVELVTNTFDVQLADNFTTWYKYEVDISVNQRARDDGTVPLPRGPPPKSVLRAVWGKLEEDEQAHRSDYFRGVMPAFDGHRAAYTNMLIPTGNNGTDPVVIPSFAAPDRRDITFSIAIRNPISISLASLRSYFTGGTNAVYQADALAEALQALNVVFAHRPVQLFYPTKTSFFVSDEAAKKLKRHDVQKESLNIAPGFLELWRGFFQAVRPCPKGLLLNINTTSTAFYMAGDLSEFIKGFLVVKGARSSSLDVGRISSHQIIQVNRLLKKLKMVVDRGTTAPKLAVKIRGAGIVDETPRRHYFSVGERQMNVEEYLFETFRIRLRYPEWPLVEVRAGTFYPLELFRVCEGNKYAKRLTPDQQQLASAFQTLLPAAKLAAVMSCRRSILDPSVAGGFTNAFGVTVDSMPKKTIGRILLPPMIAYKDPQAPPTPSDKIGTPKLVKPDDSEWMMRFSRGTFDEQFFRGGKLSSPVVVVPSERDRGAAEAFLVGLVDKARRLGMHVHPHFPPQFPHAAILVRNPTQTVDATVRWAINHVADDAYGPYRPRNRDSKEDRVRPAIIIWIFDEANSRDYHPFKRACAGFGVGSQALQKSLITKSSVQVSVNVLMKLNAKLCGYNYAIDLSTCSAWLQSNKPMLWHGADLSHEPDHPSVAVLVASMHAYGIVYEEVARVQALVEPKEADGRARKRETIVDLEDMALFLLKRRVLSTKALPPVAQLVFRDGVSESEFAAIIQTEVSAFHRASDKLKQDAEAVSILGKERLDEWKPKIVFIATLKRHHIRAFVPDAIDPQNSSRATNLLPGTVFDRDVTDPKTMDHYGIAHKALIGTARATRYVVLVDESSPRISANEVQLLVNALCHTYQRCNRSVSLPAPVFYADLIANRIRGWILPGGEDDSQSATGTHQSSSASSRQLDFDGACSILNDTDPGRDAFRGDFNTRKPPAMWWM